MNKPELISIDDLFQRFEDRDLMIVHKKELVSGITFNELEFKRKQHEAMLLDSLPVLEVVRLNLLPKYTSVNGVKKSNRFLPGEVYKNSKGNTMVCREAIKRLRKKWGLKQL